MRRRLFLALSAGWVVLARKRDSVAAVIGGSRNSAYPLTALPAYLDTIIPRDNSGSASDFGVDRQLIDQASRSRQHMRLLRAGSKWLDSEARKIGAGGFSDLDPSSREVIVERAATARIRSLPRVFFDRTRRDAFRAYYADPLSWERAGYEGPPQPKGFPDHAEAPR
jgi:hypothetical protein